MIEARAEVLRVEGTHAWLRVTDQPGGCGRCDEPGGCRSLKLTQAFKPATEVFRLPNPIGARPGDRVRVCMDDGAPLRAALTSYGLGAVLLVGGGAAGALLGGSGDAAVLVGALAGAVTAWLLNRVLMRSRQWRSGLQMRLLADDAAHCGGRHGEQV